MRVWQREKEGEGEVRPRTRQEPLIESEDTEIYHTRTRTLFSNRCNENPTITALCTL
jgi:hypothetical protein